MNLLSALTDQEYSLQLWLSNEWQCFSAHEKWRIISTWRESGWAIGINL